MKERIHMLRSFAWLAQLDIATESFSLSPPAERGERTLRHFDVLCAPEPQDGPLTPALSPSEGERAGVRGPSWGSGAQSTSKCRSVLSPRSAGGEREKLSVAMSSCANHANERSMWILSFIKELAGPSAAQPEPVRRLNWTAYFSRGLKSARLVPAAAWMPPSRCFRNSGSV